ncbi:C protein [Salmonella enterica subsp. enterica serovar Stanley]|uniref:C protein n=2 Tax=Salmonella enterica I TaxID=59201 RepID=A0A736PP85_SALET|nr:C protein [Salmonella enterica]EBS5995479.1 C protein [Salmonella enterica subsp. enterica serovar Stanley]HAD1535353.1 C protein [Salmonella enterica subsp. enterica serovar Typhimurium]EDE5463077.1 C protein [Salmonella enterica subsp. enterica serovar Stanley]EDM7405628.1 C protein [Salmonella enterica subsp. enterica serovar Stanley]
MEQILNNPRFEKYALWFMTGKIAPESGQIAPALAHYGQEPTDLPPSEKKIG